MDENEQEEDNRDVFEKALDYLSPVALGYAFIGAYVGTKIGGKLGNLASPRKPKLVKKRGRRAQMKPEDFDGRLRNRVKGRLIGGSIGGAYGLGAGNNIRAEQLEDWRK
jgi:hypothetical protein